MPRVHSCTNSVVWLVKLTRDLPAFLQHRHYFLNTHAFLNNGPAFCIADGLPASQEVTMAHLPVSTRLGRLCRSRSTL